ncbi:MAG: hypothetical protein ACJ76F_14200 [Bacteroidia bacterium]
MGTEHRERIKAFENKVEVYSTATARVYWQNDKIIRLDVIEERELDEKDLEENIDTLRSFAEGQPHIVLVDARGNWILSKEAREMMSFDETIKNISACAFLVDSLAIRLIVNFFIREGKLESSVKVFSDESKALLWLNERSGK